MSDFYEENNASANDILEEQAKIYEANIKKYQEFMMYYMEAKKAELKLASYEDKTYINEDFLIRNNFGKRIITNGKPTLPSPTYLYCDEVEEITAKCIDAEMGVWHIEIDFLDHGNTESLDICTLGQLRMFLAIAGLENIAKQLK